jgi:hypothetical protein
MSSQARCVNISNNEDKPVNMCVDSTGEICADSSNQTYINYSDGILPLDHPTLITTPSNLVFSLKDLVESDGRLSNGGLFDGCIQLPDGSMKECSINTDRLKTIYGESDNFTTSPNCDECMGSGGANLQGGADAVCRQSENWYYDALAPTSNYFPSDVSAYGGCVKLTLQDGAPNMSNIKDPLQRGNPDPHFQYFNNAETCVSSYTRGSDLMSNPLDNTTSGAIPILYDSSDGDCKPVDNIDKEMLGNVGNDKRYFVDQNTCIAERGNQETERATAAEATETERAGDAEEELERKININASNISTNATNIGINASNIAINSSNIAINASAIAQNIITIKDNTSKITTNASNISTNATNIGIEVTRATGAENVNASAIAQNISTIKENASGIAQNIITIKDNTSKITANASNIAQAQLDITTNASNITQAQLDITTNVTNIAQSQQDIADNTANITTAQGNISTAQLDISDNTANITTAQLDIVTNASNIAGIDTGTIATNATSIAQALKDISNNNTKIGKAQIDIAANTANITTAQSNISTAQLDISDNTANITDNTANIADNTANITTAQGNISTAQLDITGNTANIGLNTANIDLNTAITTGIDNEEQGTKINQALSYIKDNSRNIILLQKLLQQQQNTNASNASATTNADPDAPAPALSEGFAMPGPGIFQHIIYLLIVCLALFLIYMLIFRFKEFKEFNKFVVKSFK